jgi:DNA-binding NarL/FixJ family response regulator
VTSQQPAGKPLRIVLAEDAAIMRDGLAEILTSRGHEVVAAVGVPAGLLSAVQELRPDVAVIDVRMPPTRSPPWLAAAPSSILRSSGSCWPRTDMAVRSRR